MKKAKKILVLALSACLLVAITIGSTVAYLTDTGSVTNSFTVGKINKPDDPEDGPKYAGYLDEAKVDEDGKPIAGEDRVTSNTYKLVPGCKYTKDPTVHIGKGSEKCYVFVKVDNGIVSYIDELSITPNGWTALEGEKDVYYRTVEENDTEDQHFVVFSNFTVKGNVTKEQLETIDKQTIDVTAFIIQYAGFANKPADAYAQFKK